MVCLAGVSNVLFVLENLHRDRWLKDKRGRSIKGWEAPKSIEFRVSKARGMPMSGSRRAQMVPKLQLWLRFGSLGPQDPCVLLPAKEEKPNLNLRTWCTINVARPPSLELFQQPPTWTPSRLQDFAWRGSFQHSLMGNLTTCLKDCV